MVCYGFVIAVMLLVIGSKLLQGRKHEYVVLFVTMVVTGMILDLLSLYPRSNYGLQYLKIYYYESVEDTTE